MKIAKVLLYSLTGLTGGSSIYVGHKVFQDGRFDLNNVGLARFGRAAISVGLIGVDYKRTLFSSSSPQYGTPEYEETKTQVNTRCANRLLDLCNKNGGVFIKVGQHIGALDYLLPEEYVSTMKVLHSRAPKMELKDIYAVLHEDLGKDPKLLFDEFDDEPLGTASLAQVHKAKLKDTGEEIAIKVQHRYVKKHSWVDIQTMDFLVRVVNYVFPQFEFMWLADEMKKNLPLELSFLQEGKNAEKVSNMFSHFDWLKVPRIHWTLSTDRILVMEFCSGGFIDDAVYLKKHNIDLTGVSKKIGQMYADMIFKHGYVHCDPHPGNVLVHKNKSGIDEVILLDHGLYTVRFKINKLHIGDNIKKKPYKQF